MSSVNEDEFIQGMRESGKMDKLMAAAGFARPEAPAGEADTAEEDPEAEAPEGSEEVVEPEETVEEPEEGSAEEEVPADDGTEEVPESDDELYLDLTPEVEAYLAKYGGDLGKALEAATNAQSKIGEQGNELGQLREQLARIEQGLTAGTFEPYEWPDPELDEPMDAVNGYHRVAEQAFARQDAEAFQAALTAMNQIDPIRTQMYAENKARQVAASQAVQEPAQQLDTLVSDFRAKNPDIEKPEVQQALSAELEKFPTLAGIIQNPNGDPAERVRVLQEMYDRVASRQTADTVRQAARRVTIRTSEEARAARAAARVATADQRGSAPTEETKPDTVISLRTAEGGSFNVDEMHRAASALADGNAPEMVLRNGRLWIRQPDGSLVPRAE